MSVSPGSEVAAHCYRHPNREALVRCTRCDRPICPDCMRPASVGFHCPDDVAQGARTVRAPRTSVGAKILESRPYVTSSLVAVNVLVYVITATARGASFNAPGAARSPNALFYKWELSPSAVHDGRYYQLITCA